MKYSIALAGVVAEFGVFMLLYLKQAWQARRDNGQDTHADLSDAIREGVVLRVRPKAMTVAVILAGLLPILLGTGTGVASLNAGVADTFSQCFVISRLFAIRFMLPWNKGKPFFGENIGGVYVLQSTDISISEADIRGH